MQPERPDETTATAARPAAPGAPPPPTDGRPPRLADGIELIGEYEDSGYKEPPSIARRADGQIIQLPALLYIIAEHIDGRRTCAEIAERTSEAIERQIGEGDVEYLVAEKLRPLGIVAALDGEVAELQKADPMLALKFRVAVVPARVVRAITTVFYPLFFGPIVIAVVAGLVALDIWFFFFHGVAQSARELVYNPVLLLMVLGAVIVGTAFHEIGHATAARYGGAKPGVMGAGIYVVWPAFYTDVTDAYRLNRWGRLRTDLGGIYFNAIFALAVGGLYFITRFEPLLILVLVQHFQVLQQLLPFLRLDGYYILSDLTGVPDLFARLRPTLGSLVPGRKDERADELKRWVRGVVTAWVILLIPILFLVFGSIVINAPRIFATVYDSFLVHLEEAQAAFGGGEALVGTVSSVQMAFLTLPAAGIALSAGRTGRRALKGGWSWSEGSPPRRLAVVSGTAAVLALLGFVWWPNGDYKPIQKNERGTLLGAVQQLRYVPTGRPALSLERETELDGAENVRDEGEGGTEEERTSTAPTQTSTTQTSTTQTSTTQTSTTETSTTQTSTTETSTTETTP
jgi:putative peptide zinc metalloprotease protein